MAGPRGTAQAADIRYLLVIGETYRVGTGDPTAGGSRDARTGWGPGTGRAARGGRCRPAGPRPGRDLPPAARRGRTAARAGSSPPRPRGGRRAPAAARRGPAGPAAG